jgi:hypothetical protein
MTYNDLLVENLVISALRAHFFYIKIALSGGLVLLVRLSILKEFFSG